ncbi:MAG TPA: hypothetical protein VN729_11865 [Ktedonobacteraceae bacterium]|nr:hypothetical protein [Ktedonobacteraceae bacterium]
MQPQIASPNAGKIALRSGLTAGILLGTIHSIIAIVSTIQNAGVPGSVTASSTLFYLLTPLIWIVGLLAAGAWGSKITGKLSTGTLAGLFAGLFGGIVAGFGQAIATAISVNLSQNPYQSSSLVLLGGFAIIFYILMLAIGAGAGCGALGGLIGQSISDVRPQLAPQPHPIAQPTTPVYQPPTVPYAYMPRPQPTPQMQEHLYQEQVMRLPEQ